MSKLQLHGTVWLAADIHLGPHSPKTAHAFYQFLHQARHQADALILCGDIFNAWIGADLAIDPPAWLARTIHHFRAATQEIPVFFMRGNRDFLLDNLLAQYVGAQLLNDQILLQTDHYRLILTHGDELCTDDEAYQRFRKWVRNPTIQSLFLALPLSWRQRIAGGLRQKSSKKQKHLNPMISDVNTASCADLLLQHQEYLLVHGHTHRPAIHKIPTHTESALTRIVLPDWEYDHSEPTRAGWLAFTPDGQITLHRSHETTLRFRLKLLLLSLSLREQ